MALTTMATKTESNPQPHKKKERKKRGSNQKRKRRSEIRRRKLSPMERKKRKRRTKSARKIKEVRGMAKKSMASFSNQMAVVPITKIG